MPLEKNFGFFAFLKRKDVEVSAQRYLIGAFGHMALGLFASLLIGTIFATMAERVPGLGGLSAMADYARGASGPAMAIAIAFALNAPPLVLFSCAAVGSAGNALGGPVGCLVAACVGGRVRQDDFQRDTRRYPPHPCVNNNRRCCCRQAGRAAGGEIYDGFRRRDNVRYGAAPILYGYAGFGVSRPGCCAQMVGFAVMSFPENSWGGLVSQGLGTSMLQFPNIIRNPYIWIPPTLASVITGPVATLVFRLENIPVGAGMGTSGLVGPLGVISAMPGGGIRVWLGILFVCFLLPAVLTLVFARILRKFGFIRSGDLFLNMG